MAKQPTPIPFVDRRYKSIAASELGQKIWSYLNKNVTIAYLERAIELERPALVGMGWRLIEKFGDDVKNDTIKQAIGAMVRQILESRGHQFLKANVQFRNDELFASGAKYIFIKPQMDS